MRALQAFDRAGIGREPLDREAASDQMIRTTVTAASVGATLLDSPAAGLGRLNPVTRAIRGAMRLPYWVTLGLTAGSKAAALLAILGLAIGGALLALTLLGVLSGPIAGLAGSLGTGAAVLAFGYAAMRSGSFLHGVVLLGGAAPLLVVGAREIAAFGDGEQGASGTSAVAAIVVLTVVLVVLGTLPTPLQSPAVILQGAVKSTMGRMGGWGVRLWKRARLRWLRWLRWLGSAVGLGLVLGLLSLTGLGERLGEVLPARPDSLEAFATASIWYYVVVAVIGLAVAWFHGLVLRTWRQSGTRWELPPVTISSGVTIGWSWVYGFVTAALTFVVIRPAAIASYENTAGASGIDSPLVWVVLGQVAALALLLVVPAVTPSLTSRRLRRGILKLVEAGLFVPSAVREDGAPPPKDPLIQWLLDRGMAVRYLVRDSLVPFRESSLELNHRGISLALRIHEIRMRQHKAANLTRDELRERNRSELALLVHVPEADASAIS